MYSSNSGANRISTSAAGDRLFVYEVAGLSQKKETDNFSYPIRRSGSVFYTVPYKRMNQEMRRITRLGGRILSIKPLNTDSLQPSPAPESPPSQGAITDFITENRITGGYNARFVAEKFPELPAIPTNLPTDRQNLSLTSDMTFPRSTDEPPTMKRTIGSPDSVPVYEYIVTNINLSGGRNITITPGKKVIFYVQGDISSTSNGGIKHDCSSVEEGTTCEPTNFQIFAYNTSNSNNPQICLKGNSRLDAFIFAPDYLIGKTADVQYYGSIWGKSWGKIANCGSNNISSNPPSYSFEQKGQWSSLYNDLKPAVPLPKIGQVRNWREVPIN